jgi:hypothetical protein
MEDGTPTLNALLVDPEPHGRFHQATGEGTLLLLP